MRRSLWYGFAPPAQHERRSCGLPATSTPRPSSTTSRASPCVTATHATQWTVSSPPSAPMRTNHVWSARARSRCDRLSGAARAQLLEVAAPDPGRRGGPGHVAAVLRQQARDEALLELLDDAVA